MERYTRRKPDGHAVMDCKACEASWCAKHPGQKMPDCTALYCRNRLKNRVAAYEDLELTPEEIAGKLALLNELIEKDTDINRIKNLMDADKEGYVAILKCRVGDVVYPVVDRGRRNEGGHLDWYPWKLESLGAACNASERIGVDVFRTKEEAEKYIAEQ